MGVYPLWGKTPRKGLSAANWVFLLWALFKAVFDAFKRNLGKILPRLEVSVRKYHCHAESTSHYHAML